ncbi:MAG: pentapeptide repeat-containing protein [Spirulinaceae cyanobacterium]
MLALAPLVWAMPALAADPADVQQLLETNQCVNCDLSGAELAGVNLFGANLVNANLANADLSGANLGNVNLIDANLSDANLAGAYLYEARLDDATLDRANLSGAYLREQDLSNTSLDGAQLQGANLSYAYLAGVSLAGADLEGVNFKQAHLTGTETQLAETFGIDLTQGVMGVAFCGGFLEDFPLFGSGPDSALPIQLDEERDMLRFADFTNANLSNANLQGANLVGANLRDANLQGANLRGACLPYAELHDANLANAQLEGATVSRAVFARTTLTGATGADLSDAYRSDQERQIEIWQADAKKYLRQAANEQRGIVSYDEEEFVADLGDLNAEQPDDSAYAYSQILQPVDDNGIEIAILEATPRRPGLQGYAAVVIAEAMSDDEDEETWVEARVMVCESDTSTTTALVQAPIALAADESFECPTGTSEISSSPYGY